MKFPRFDMERMQSVWEHKVNYDLSESGVEALTLAEITRDPKELMKTRLGYAEGMGRDATRTLIAGIHPGHDADDVMMTTGTSEANFLALASLVSPGDEVVVVMPNYMQVHGIATALGAPWFVLWIVATLLFKLWVTSVADFKSPIGSLTVLLFLSWYVFTSSAIFLVGAQIDELLRKETNRQQSRLLEVIHGRSSG